MRLERAAEWLQPSRWAVRWIALLVQVLKVLGWLELMGGVIYAIAVAATTSSNTGMESLTAGQRNTVAFAIGIGALAIAALWWWLAYVLQALLGIWRLSAVDAMQR